MSNKDYQVIQIKSDFQYVERILHKYHKASEFLHEEFDKETSIKSTSYPRFEEELYRLEKLSKNGIIELKRLSDITINVFAKLDEKGNTSVLDLLDMSKCNQTELACIETLTVIVQKYCSHDYYVSFARHLGENMSDKEANDNDKAFINQAYTILKDLKNLLLFKIEGFVNNNIVIDHSEQKTIETGQMKPFIIKENQILLNDPLIMSKLATVLIGDTLNKIRYSDNEYLNRLKFEQYTIDTLTYDFVNNEFEGIRGMVEKSVKGKTPSKKAVFKGMISKLVKKYVKDEQLTFAEKEVDERQAQLLAYKLLAMFGLISIDLINSHKNRDARIKYMDSLPQWTDDPILPNRMKLISTEEMLKNYSPL